MTEPHYPRLGRHTMTHVRDLRVDPILFQPVFRDDCEMRNCTGACCAEGVLLDPADKAKILRHTDLIQKYLEPGMETDPSRWFDGDVQPDKDFPSGVCEGTRATERGCIFLDAKGLCTLQKAAMGEGMDRFALKPFYCVAYPLTMDAGVLTLEDPDFTNRPMCCSAITTGTRTSLDVCREEYEHMLGNEGLIEFERLHQQHRTNPPTL
jgi:hypothetical protein